MVRTASTMLPLGTIAPDFSLPDAVSGRIVSLTDFVDSKAILIIFLCNHCPYVKHVRSELTRLTSDYAVRGVASVGISSNDVAGYPQDSPELMRTEARDAGYAFPYLYDETQEVAKAYRAACTPDFYVFNADRRLAYRGQLDDSRPSSGVPVTGVDLRAALDALLAGKAPAPEQKASLGCNIKWKPGNEPDYFG